MKIDDVEVDGEDVPPAKYEDPCRLTIHQTGKDYSYIMNEETGRIEKTFTDGHIETLAPAYDSMFDSYGPEWPHRNCWD